VNIADDPEWDMEPVYQTLLAQRAERRKLPPYTPRTTGQITEALTSFFAQRLPGAKVGAVASLVGGASKEQFFFSLDNAGDVTGRYVMRKDPLEGITETSRQREFEVLNAVQGVVPAPRAFWIDEDGGCFGRPAVIMSYAPGVTKPTSAAQKVSGLGTILGDRLRSKLRGQFLDNLVALHGVDWRKADLPSFAAPVLNPKQAALWSLNFWRQLWRMDQIEPVPIMSYAEQWLSDNLPGCDELVLTHGDYRTGNYLFDEESGKINAMLDWELARIGDYHEDLAWVLLRLFATFEDGIYRASDLYGRDEFIGAYEATSKRKVNHKTLHFYEVMCAWKMYIICAANGMSAARAQHNHQDVLLTFTGAVGPLAIFDLCRMLKQGAGS